ncbi:nitroreductase [Actinomyces radicidentis]|uniref:Nitroreductase n=1 Tax=Actinomyces radicidentis TaxID=111015 RepID=A0A0X8JEA3_ACTRD|nr:malonic semialdehyde reductase [Actinomyces radicidentis]AMD86863.1 nitroreductase [Actinomyces radicidentis]
MTDRADSVLHPSVPAPVPDECLLTESDAQLLFGGARTVYAFTDEPVTDEELRAIHELAKWAPTAVNAQPLRVVAVRSEEARARLLPCLPRGNREQPAGAPLTLVCAADRGFTETLERVHPRGARHRALLAEGGPGMTAAWARTSATVQVGFLIQAIRAVGLAAGPMNGDRGEELAAEFFPGQDVEVLAVINVGHPGEDACQVRNERLAFDEVYRVL